MYREMDFTEISGEALEQAARSLSDSERRGKGQYHDHSVGNYRVYVEKAGLHGYGKIQPVHPGDN